MASQNFTHWEVDPFFSAAEEVQNSADRMESTFRSWRRWKETPELESSGYVEACRRDLTIAVDTVKWQLEEFERAVQLQASKEPRYLNRASSRHHQFVRAIRQHISSVEKDLWLTISDDKIGGLNPNLKVNENDHLAEFLSGSRLAGYELMHDDHMAIPESKEWTVTVSHTPVRSFSSSGNGDASPAIPSTTHTARAQKTCDGFQHREEIRPREMADACLHGSVYNNEPRTNGTLISARHDCERCMDANASTRNETSIDMDDHVLDFQVPENLGNGLGFWGLWKGKKGSAWLQLSDSGFKRWKDGDANLAEEFENAASLATIPLPKNVCTNDLEQSYINKAGNHRKSCSSVASEVDCFETKHSNGGWESLQLPIRPHQNWSYGSVLHLIFGVLVVIGFVSIYFWFLSTIVPTEIDTVVPGHFPN